MRLKLLAAVLWTCLTPCAHAQPDPVYFVVDASGSMKANNQSDAEALLRELSLPDDRPISITYFGAKPSEAGADLCTEHLEPPKATLRGADFNPHLPTLGGDGDKTAIGNALESVLRSRDGQGKFVLITDGLEECRTDYLGIRNRYPDAEINVRQVGRSPNAALELLEVAPRTNQPSAVAALPLPTPLPVVIHAPRDEEASWQLRAWWIALIGISALAATLFCLQSAERTNSLQDQLAQLSGKSGSELQEIYTPNKNRNGKLVRKRDSERYHIHWFKNRDGKRLLSYGFYAFCFLLIAIFGWLCLSFRELALVFFAEDSIRGIRRDSWDFLNSNIGAYSFAGTIIALVGFSAFQWWQTIEAKKQLMISSGIISRERAQVAQRQYDVARRSIRNTRLRLPARYVYWAWSFEEVEISGFDALQSALWALAAPPFEVASEAQRQGIQRFVNVRDPLGFATLLKLDGHLAPSQLERIGRLLELAKSDQLLDAAAITAEVTAELSATHKEETAA